MLNSLNMFLLALKVQVMSFLTDEEGDTNIVSMVVLIGIAVLLAVVFKNAIGDLIEQLIGTITGTANDAITNAPN